MPIHSAAKWPVVAAAVATITLPCAGLAHRTAGPTHAASYPSTVAAPQQKAVPVPSAFDREQRMSFGQRMNRWNPFVAEASRRFAVPEDWVRAVMRVESGGRTMSGENRPITSGAGAMGLMQIMPSTYEDMRAQYRLGPDPYDPRDNILAGAAYLRWLRARYGYPRMFAAYNDGPGHLDERLEQGGLLPPETRDYLGSVTGTLAVGGAGLRRNLVKFTRPNGMPVMIDGGAVISVRAAFPGEYAPGVQAVISVGRLRQGVRESVAQAKAAIRAHGGAV